MAVLGARESFRVPRRLQPLRPRAQRVRAVPAAGPGPARAARTSARVRTPTATREQCARTGVTAAQYGNILENPAGQYNSLDGGNPDAGRGEGEHRHRRARVDAASRIAGLSLTADYYDIKIEDTHRRLRARRHRQDVRRGRRPRCCATWSTATRWARCGSPPTPSPIATNQNIGQRGPAAWTSRAGLPLEPRRRRVRQPSRSSAARCWRTGCRHPAHQLRLRRLLRQPVRHPRRRSGGIACGRRGTPTSRRPSPWAGASSAARQVDDLSDNPDLGQPGPAPSSGC